VEWALAFWPRYARGVVKLIIFLGLATALAVCGSTVKFGNRTFFGHIRAIWATDEVQDLKNGVKEKAGPTAGRLKRGVEAGYNAMKDDGSAAGSGAAASGSAAPSGSAAEKPQPKKRAPATGTPAPAH
jgi:hypothetical protein